MRLRRSRVSALLLPLMLLAGVMGACGDDDDDEETGGGATTTTAVAGPAGSARIDIAMSEYAYDVSGALIEGGTINLTNPGDEMHMLAVAKLKPGASVGDIIAAASQGPGGGEEEGEAGDEEEGAADTTTSTGRVGATGTATTSTTASGSGSDEQEPGDEEGEEDPTAQFIEKELGMPGSLMLPGGRAEITVPKLAGPGRYVLACFIPTEGDGQPHIAKGMASELEVVGGTAPTPQAEATYRAAAGEAVEGPATLTPGRKVLKIETTGPGASELEPSLVKLKPNTTFQDVDDAFRSFFGEGEDAPPPARGAASRIPLDSFVSLFDFEEADAVYLGVDLTPGTWDLVVSDSDVEEAPAEPVERITIRVG